MKKTYVLVGTGGRSRLYYEAIAGDFKDCSQLLAICDTNQTRMDYANRILHEKFNYPILPSYKNNQFDDMIRKHQPDIVIVTSIDRTHHHYIVRAMELGCDVITEKPMTIDIEKLKIIFDAIERTGRKLRVTFNYRYAPHSTKMRELIMKGTVGNVHSVHFEWLLDTQHGADYFRRWHRDKKNSGGLLVHKSTHHFDLINFWLGTTPELVFAQGALMFYGKENAEKRGEARPYYRTTGVKEAEKDPFAIDMESSEGLNDLYYKAEHEDGYLRDRCVFDDGISIEDTLSVLVRYKNKAMLTYSLNAYMPWEGFRVAINGDKGRIEMLVVESSYVNADGQKDHEGVVKSKTIKVFPMFGKPYDVDINEAAGGHGGGDPVLLNDLFGTPEPDPFERAASHVDGAMSILTGIAANQSIHSELPVKIDELMI